MVAYFQLWVGIYMFFLCLITLINTTFRFVEISETDRGQFSNEQNKARRDKKEQKLAEAIKGFMSVGQNDVEILRCQKPNQKNLFMILFQKCIYDILAGIYAATAGATIYSVFDYITFEETLLNHLEAADSSSKTIS